MVTSFQETIDGFLFAKNITPDGKSTIDFLQDSMYKPKIDAFRDYCIPNVLNNDWITYLKTFTSDDVIQSARTFIRTRQREIKKIGIKFYLIIVNEYFKYLSTIEIPNTPVLAAFDLWEDDDLAISKQIDVLAEEFGLSSEETATMPLTPEEALTLMKVCSAKYKKTSSEHY